MVNRIEVTLDDPAAEYLPEQVRMPERSGKAITLLDLSTHNSGLPRVPGDLNPNDPTNPYANYSVDDLYQFLSRPHAATRGGADGRRYRLRSGRLL
jgi:D-alanyl-D-alanine-carboxypeptidase/D-alanyl-D-alanine-endopeptidase